MADKEGLRKKVDEFEELLPGRKNGDRRIHGADDVKLVELLREIIDALPN